MARLKPLLARLLALLLLVQSGAALGHCLRGLAGGGPAPDGGWLVEICTLEGKRLVRLDAGGEPTEAPAPAAEGGFCPACHGLPQILLPPPLVQPLPPQRLADLSWGGEPRLFAPPPARAPPYVTRAPPALA